MILVIETVVLASWLINFKIEYLLYTGSLPDTIKCTINIVKLSHKRERKRLIYVQLINKIRYCLLSGFWIRKDRWQSGFCGRHVREPAKIDSLIKTRGVIFVHISTKMGTNFVDNISSTYFHPYNLKILLIPTYSISQEKWIKARATPAKKCLGARY